LSKDLLKAPEAESALKHDLVGEVVVDRLVFEGVGETELLRQHPAQGSVMRDNDLGLVLQVCSFLQGEGVIQIKLAGDVFPHGEGEVVQEDGRTELTDVINELVHVRVFRELVRAAGILGKKVLDKACLDAEIIEPEHAPDGVFQRIEEGRDQRRIQVFGDQAQGFVLEQGAALGGAVAGGGVVSQAGEDVGDREIGRIIALQGEIEPAEDGFLGGRICGDIEGDHRAILRTAGEGALDIHQLLRTDHVEGEILRLEHRAEEIYRALIGDKIGIEDVPDQTVISEMHKTAGLEDEVCGIGGVFEVIHGAKDHIQRERQRSDIGFLLLLLLRCAAQTVDQVQKVVRV
jgi:hypothetical protein